MELDLKEVEVLCVVVTALYAQVEENSSGYLLSRFGEVIIHRNTLTLRKCQRYILIVVAVLFTESLRRGSLLW